MLRKSAKSTTLSTIRITAAILALFWLWYIHHHYHPSFIGIYYNDQPEPSSDGQCEPELFHGIDDILVVLRTGASEAPAKLPIHFNTTLRCAPHFIIFSDMEEYIEGHHVLNALDEVDPDIVASHPDFDYYRLLLEKGRAGITSEEAERWSAAANTKAGRDTPGWRLDKWKFLPIAEKSLAHRPDAKWYFFIEADSYILWPALLEWLSHFDHLQPHYIGMQMQIGEVVFAYGGAGFILSNVALREMVKHWRSKLKQYDEYTAGHWAGDCILGKVLADAGVGLLWAWPNLFGDQPKDMDFDSHFGGSDKRLWCHHVSSYHHVSPPDAVEFSEFEHSWYRQNATLLRHKDVFYHYVLPQLRPERVDWNNLSEDDEWPVETFQTCRDLCEKQPDCLQFSTSGKICRTSRTFTLGHPTLPQTGQLMSSGWIPERIGLYAQRMDASCMDQDWIVPPKTSKMD